jgi:hypothetical protein
LVHSQQQKADRTERFSILQTLLPFHPPSRIRGRGFHVRVFLDCLRQSPPEVLERRQECTFKSRCVVRTDGFRRSHRIDVWVNKRNWKACRLRRLSNHPYHGDVGAIQSKAKVPAKQLHSPYMLLLQRQSKSEQASWNNNGETVTQEHERDTE